jgi:hypothetical protein
MKGMREIEDWIHLHQVKVQYSKSVKTTKKLTAPLEGIEFRDELSDYQLVCKNTAPYSYVTVDTSESEMKL